MTVFAHPRPAPRHALPSEPSRAGWWLLLGVVAAGLALGPLTGQPSVSGTAAATSVPNVRSHFPPRGASFTERPLATRTVVPSWDGRTGALRDTTLFFADLEHHAGRYAVRVDLAADGLFEGWDTMQLELEVVPVADGDECAAYDFDGSAPSEVLRADRARTVTFRGLLGGQAWCVGIAGSDAGAADSVLVRRSADERPTSPTLAASVERLP
jgi:hypothetical protein